MSDKSKIEWTDATWNPVTGCTKVSQGCKNCYAERNWARLVHMPDFAGRAFTDVACHPDRLDQPLHWKKPRRVFVDSMSDLFHPDVPSEFIRSAFDRMEACPQHTFQILTKRAARMQFLLWSEWDWKPAPNIWLGVSIEDQATADERIPLLLETPAAVRWVSAEPLLGPVNIKPWLQQKMFGPYALNGDAYANSHETNRLDWVVVGGESGPNARPMQPQWPRDLLNQCAAAGVPFMFKQWGEWLSAELDECPCGPPARDWMWADGVAWTKYDGQRGVPLFRRVGKRVAGRLLDGIQHDGYPGASA